MPFADLRQWIAALEGAGELKRIRTEVDPILEITEITDRVSKGQGATTKEGAPSKPSFGLGGPSGGPALLFQNIKGRDARSGNGWRMRRREQERASAVIEKVDEIARTADIPSERSNRFG